MVRLELGKRDDEVGGQHRHGQRERPHAGKPAAERNLAHVVVIEVDESNLRLAQVIEQSRRAQQVLDVAPMSRPFADHDLARAGAQERGRRADDDERVRVDGVARLGTPPCSA